MTDFAKKYADEHKAYIYFSDGRQTIKLPAFLSSFSIDMSIDREKISKLTNDYTVYRDKGVSYTYNFAIDVPFYNREEAIKGKEKIDTLERFARPQSSVRTQEYLSKGIKVLFRNLINNGAGTTSVKSHGASVILSNINVEYNADFGFFDKSQKFYSKLYTLSFSANVIVVKEGFRDICHGFEANGNYNVDDVKWWPFQIKKESYSYRSPNMFESQYISGHNAKMTFQHISAQNVGNENKRSITINAFIDNFSKSNSYEFAKKNLGADVYTPKEIKEVSYKFLVNFPANNKNQAIQNMIMAQKLFRIFAPPKVAAGHSFGNTMTFANLVPAETIYLNSISLKVDTDMGFFDRDKKFYIKNFSIDFTAEKAIKAELAEGTEPESSEGDEADLIEGGSGSDTPSIESRIMKISEIRIK